MLFGAQITEMLAVFSENGQFFHCSSFQGIFGHFFSVSSSGNQKNNPNNWPLRFLVRRFTEMSVFFTKNVQFFHCSPFQATFGHFFSVSSSGNQKNNPNNWPLRFLVRRFTEMSVFFTKNVQFFRCSPFQGIFTHFFSVSSSSNQKINLNN